MMFVRRKQSRVARCCWIIDCIRCSWRAKYCTSPKHSFHYCACVVRTRAPPSLCSVTASVKRPILLLVHIDLSPVGIHCSHNLQSAVLCFALLCRYSYCRYPCWTLVHLLAIFVALRGLFGSSIDQRLCLRVSVKRALGWKCESRGACAVDEWCSALGTTDAEKLGLREIWQEVADSPRHRGEGRGPPDAGEKLMGKRRWICEWQLDCEWYQ